MPQTQQNDFNKAFNDPNSQIVGGQQNDFTKAFNDPNSKMLDNRNSWGNPQMPNRAVFPEIGMRNKIIDPNNQFDKLSKQPMPQQPPMVTDPNINGGKPFPNYQYSLAGTTPAATQGGGGNTGNNIPITQNSPYSLVGASLSLDGRFHPEILAAQKEMNRLGYTTPEDGTGTVMNGRFGNQDAFLNKYYAAQNAQKAQGIKDFGGDAVAFGNHIQNNLRAPYETPQPSISSPQGQANINALPTQAAPLDPNAPSGHSPAYLAANPQFNHTAGQMNALSSPSGAQGSQPPINPSTGQPQTPQNLALKQQRDALQQQLFSLQNPNNAALTQRRDALQQQLAGLQGGTTTAGTTGANTYQAPTNAPMGTTAPNTGTPSPTGGTPSPYQASSTPSPYEQQISDFMAGKDPQSQQVQALKDQQTALEDKQTALGAQQKALGRNLEQGNQNIDAQPGVVQGIKSGQQLALARQLGIDKGGIQDQQQTLQAQQQTLQQKLANMQSQRQASLDAVQYSLSREDTRKAAAQTQSNADRTRQDALAKETEVIRHNKADEANNAAKYAPGIIGEYQYAVSQGYEGGFTQYENEDANRKRSTAATDPFSNYNAKQASQQKIDQTDLATQMAKRVGTDGYLSPQNYKHSKQVWITKGYSGADYDKIFGGYVNPQFPGSYSNTFQSKPFPTQ